jgi:hypothetical protein
MQTARRSGRRAGLDGRRLLVEDDHWRLRQDAPISSSPIAWRRPSAARLPLKARASPDGRPAGEGFARPRSGRSRDVRPWPPVCARFRPRLRSSARARTAHSRVVPCERRKRRIGDDRIGAKGGALRAVPRLPSAVPIRMGCDNAHRSGATARPPAYLSQRRIVAVLVGRRARWATPRTWTSARGVLSRSGSGLRRSPW